MPVSRLRSRRRRASRSRHSLSCSGAMPRRRAISLGQEYVDVETAKQTGRASFGDMVAYLKAHPMVRVLLGREDRPPLSQSQGLGDDRRARRGDPPRQGRRGAVAQLALLREVHARHQGADGKELHRQSVGGSAQGACRRRPSRASGRQRRRSDIAMSTAQRARRSSTPTRRSRRSSRSYSSGTRPANSRSRRRPRRHMRRASSIARVAIPCRSVPSI